MSSDLRHPAASRDWRDVSVRVSVSVANRPVSLRQISRTGFVVYSPDNCCTGRVAYCSFRVSSTLTVTLQARCVACSSADRYGTRVSRFEFVEPDSETSNLLDSALNLSR